MPLLERNAVGPLTLLYRMAFNLCRHVAPTLAVTPIPKVVGSEMQHSGAYRRPVAGARQV